MNNLGIEGFLNSECALVKFATLHIEDIFNWVKNAEKKKGQGNL